MRREYYLKKYATRVGNCKHINEDDRWGIAYDCANGDIIHVFSKAEGGLWAYSYKHNTTTPLSDAAQFTGTNSRAVKSWMDKE